MAEMKVEELTTSALVPNDANPNEMDERTFNALCEAISTEGWVEPPQVVPIEDGKYEIVGGHHRWEAAKVLGMETIPCVVLDPEKFHKDRRDWNVVKMNVIRGKLNPEKFTRLYSDLAKRYDPEVMKTLMGFTSDDAFQKVFQEVKRALPPGLRDAMDAAKDEIRTIDDLSLVLNRLFAEHGETLPSNMMVFSWGGKEVLWVRCSAETWEIVSLKAKEAANLGEDFDATVREAFVRGLAG